MREGCRASWGNAVKALVVLIRVGFREELETALDQISDGRAWASRTQRLGVRKNFYAVAYVRGADFASTLLHVQNDARIN